jgi:hypothetical protein
MRLFVAGLIAAVAVGGALAVRSYDLQPRFQCSRVEQGDAFGVADYESVESYGVDPETGEPLSLVKWPCTRFVHGMWQTPAAAAIALIGLGAVGGVLTARRRRGAESRLRLP